MKPDLYAPHTANYPRLRTDKLFEDPRNRCEFHGYVDDMIRYVESFQ